MSSSSCSCNCECIVKDTILGYDIDNNPDDVIINYNMNDLIPEFNPSISGIWRPVFWSKQPKDSNNKTWQKAYRTQTCSEDVITPNGLGINQFIVINEPKFKNWEVSGTLQLSADLIINFEKCRDYTETILFWYRYYDIGRINEKRILPGIDIFMSDGDYARISGIPRVTPSLSGVALTIKSRLDNANVGDSLYKACVLASGPQIDGVTELLAGTDRGLEYPRDEYGLMQPFLSGMSLKRYSDIGSNNFIVDKVDLLKKIVEKYGLQIIVPEGCQATLQSKFKSITGPNLQIKTSGDLYLSDKKQKSGYDINFKAGNLQLTAEQSNEIFIPKTQITENNQKEVIEAEPHNVNYFRLNTKIIGYNLSNSVSGIFDPNIYDIKFHGLGGVDFTTSNKFGSSCLENVTVETDPNTKEKRAYYTDSLTIKGPWFVQDYQDENLVDQGIESEETNISISIKAHANSQFRLNDKISIRYLRSDTKPTCESFVSNICKCFPLTSLNPNASGQAKLENKNNLLYLPNTSYYRLPSGWFYGGLNAKQVNAYGVKPPNHPNPETPFPRIHSKFFPMDQSCAYTLNGCGDREISFTFPYAGDIRLSYQSTKGNFNLKWEDKSISNPDPQFTSIAGTICLSKVKPDPQEVKLKITVPKSEPQTQWGIQISGIQRSYALDPSFGGFPIQAKKGFFHPNFGWTFDESYYNLTPIIPFHKGTYYRRNSNKNSLAGYRLSVRYSDTEGPCPGGHYCNRAKFNIYVNDIFIGVANLNNAGGADDEGSRAGGDRSASFLLPSSVQLRDGNRVDILIKCAYENCHGGISWVEITTNTGEIIFTECIGTERTIPIYLRQLQNNYFYNAYAMYNEQYLPGYNFMYSLSGLTTAEKYTIKNSAYVGIPTNGNSYYIPSKWTNTHYVPSDSLILEQMPFEYIDFNHFYGYAYNDFKYEEQSNGKVLINSTDGDERASTFLDSPEFKNDKFIFYSYSNPDETTNVTVNYASGNLIGIDQSPLDNKFKKGYLARGADTQSAIIYQPYITRQDQEIKVGKWGNMSYGDAVIEASKYFSVDQEYDLRRYNNSSLRTGISRNTSLSWGAPIAIINDYDVDQKTYYFPVTRLFPYFINGIRIVHNVGFDNKYVDPNSGLPIPRPEGDRIIASGNIDQTSGYLYLGSYIGNYEIALTVSNNSIKNGNIKLYHMGQEVASTNLANKDDKNILYLNYNKRNPLPIYAKIVLTNNSNNCVALNSSASSKLIIKTYAVKISDSIPDLNSKSRLAYYAHASNRTGLKTGASYAYGYPDTTLNINNAKASPLSRSIYYLRKKSVDYTPYMDMHVFAKNTTYMPFTKPSGYIYFEDFFRPKNNTYISNNMEVPYHEDLYWIDIPKDNQEWNILTSRGYLLEQNKTYKILKNITYECKGKAEECSAKYPKDICNDTVYDLSEGEVLELLGLGGNDKDLFDIQIQSFPNYCSSIDYCCDQKDSESEKQTCLANQKRAREDCAKFWKDKKYNTSCLDVCPTGNITGIIYPSVSYYLFKIKNDAKPNLDSLTDVQLKFFNSSKSRNIPCTNSTVSTVGTSFYRDLKCANANQCSYITPIEYTLGSQYVPGDMIDLSPLTLGVTWGEYPVPSAVILENEKLYRSFIPHPNPISFPYEEYDEDAKSKYSIIHNFDIKSKKCISAGKLFDIAVDNVVCSFELLINPSGSIIRSSCFKDIIVKNNPNKITVDKTICDGIFSCKSDGSPCEGEDDPDCNPSTATTIYIGGGISVNCDEDPSCDKAQEYLDQHFGNKNYTVIDCEDVSNLQDYYLDCRYCGPFSCSASISYYEPMEEECHCPSWAELEDAPPNEGWDVNKLCRYSVKATVFTNNGCGDTTSVESCGWWWDWGWGGCVFPASCFAKIDGPSEEELKNYEDSCKDGVEQTLSRTEQEVVFVGESASPEDYVSVANKNVEEESKYRKKICEINEKYNKCVKDCNDNYQQCRANNPGDPQVEVACSKQLSACNCSCQADSISSRNEASADRTVYYNCYSYCNISDGIWNEFDYGWWGWWWGDNCNNNPCFDSNYAYYWWQAGSSWKNAPDDPCAPGGCDYKACDNLEKRMSMSNTISECECKKDNNGYTNLSCVPKCVDIKTENNKVISRSNKIYTREKKYISKTKSRYVSMKDRSTKSKTRKIINKKFEISYKSKEDCKNCDKEQICCDNKCIDKETECCEKKADINLNLRFEIYDNIISVFLNNNAEDRLCVNRGNYDLFKCPKIKFESKNNLLYICDSVTSECTNCYTGEMI